jgi:hypothetical protein
MVLAAGALIAGPEAKADTFGAEEAEAFGAFEYSRVPEKAPVLAARTGVKSIFGHRNLPLRAKIKTTFYS